MPDIINSYSKIAKKYLAVPILKSSAKQFLFMHTLCFLAMDDVVGAKKAIQMNAIEDPSFDGSREMQLCEALITCIEEGNRDGYSVAVSEYNNITPLTRSQTSIIVKIKDAYLPDDPNSMAGQQFETKDLDFTGAAEDGAPPAGLHKQSSANAPPPQEDNDFC